MALWDIRFCILYIAGILRAATFCSLFFSIQLLKTAQLGSPIEITIRQGILAI
jgi:hypothetical protein